MGMRSAQRLPAIAVVTLALGGLLVLSQTSVRPAIRLQGQPRPGSHGPSPSGQSRTTSSIASPSGTNVTPGRASANEDPADPVASQVATDSTPPPINAALIIIIAVFAIIDSVAIVLLRRTGPPLRLKRRPHVTSDVPVGPASVGSPAVQPRRLPVDDATRS